MSAYETPPRIGAKPSEINQMSNSNGFQQLERRIREPETAERLIRLLDRLESIEKTLDRVEQAVEHGPAMVSTIADVTDDLADRAHAAGIDLDERVHHTLLLLEKLTDPATVAALSGLLDRMDQIEQLAALTDDIPGFISIMVDAIDEVYHGAAAVGIDIDARVRSTFAFGKRLTDPATVEALDHVLDPNAVGFVGMLGETLAKCQQECLAQPEPYSVTMLGAMKALRDPDARRALGFLTKFAQMFGKAMVARHAQLANANPSPAE